MTDKRGTSTKEQNSKTVSNIILLGDPAAGKATQAVMLVKQFGLYDLDMGVELNKLRTQSSEVEKALTGSTDKGKLTPTVIVRNIFRDILKNIPTTQGILFDGTPKMLGEAKLVIGLLKKFGHSSPIVIYLSIPLEETVKRMTARNGYDAGKFGKRADDTARALKNRVRYYRKNVTEVVSFLKSKFPYKKISGIGTVSEVHKSVIAAIDDLNSKRK